jgi:23S rRNA (guanosine2251-2'-O)-methyltransferase
VVTSRGRNDRKSSHRAQFARQHPRPGQRSRAAANGEWLWGLHAVIAALDNPAREAPGRVLLTQERARALGRDLGPAVEIVEAGQISSTLPDGAVHQGIALDIAPLAPTPLAGLAQPSEGIMVMLDQVTDPQNVGAIFRTAAAFGARGVILQDRHAPPLAGALAKAAAGAVDKIPHAREINLSRALEQLEDLGWRAIGLDGGAPEALADALDRRPTVLVLGSEGVGLRRLVREHCDVLARIPIHGGMESLNVSVAAAVALYAASRR